MSNTSLMPSSPKSDTPWWKIPHVLLIPALLLSGVVATSTMVVISSMDQDPVLDKEVYERERRAALALEGQAKVDALMAVQPAQQGRNHAASPLVPTDN
ncbi:hypothetical protein J2W49_000737 [Hydrogenophaga palleronii]|uniref:Nitrogen fixation protein FixH n=1 Tax=Hydrogenophaga palleronii TaxID=65655 RepID=A0ABU1WID4_9BURK|nr:nitrogen fixation protein FixH [Hydrogenophaga palleronii]MDR7148809.1 hypothetical protein [Hydrogenophaga palleronii]